MDIKNLKYMIDNLPLEEKVKEELLTTAKIFFEYQDFLISKNPGIDEDVVQKTYDLKFKIRLEKLLDNIEVDLLEMSDDDIMDIGLDLMVEIAKEDGFERYLELKESSKVLLKYNI